MNLIIFTGAPASGKSSIAEFVGNTIEVPSISKDAYKIILFEKFGFSNHSEKKKLSIQGEEEMYDCIREYVKANKDLIVDNNFKHFDRIRDILQEAQSEVNVICIYCIADYTILANRYNERIRTGNRHPSLYTLNQYPIVDGISKFHPIITAEDVERIEQTVREPTFGNSILTVRTDTINTDFSQICLNVLSFITCKRI